MFPTPTEFGVSQTPCFSHVQCPISPFPSPHIQYPLPHILCPVLSHPVAGCASADFLPPRSLGVDDAVVICPMSQITCLCPISLSHAPHIRIHIAYPYYATSGAQVLPCVLLSLVVDGLVSCPIYPMSHNLFPCPT